MSSTYSTSLRIQLIDTGTELEAWGTPTDNNLGTIIEQAITGVSNVSIANLTNYTLTTANAAVDQARNAVVIFTGALSANCNVVAPSVNKVYVVSNQTTGGKNVLLKTSGGNAIILTANSSQLVYCNGTDFKSINSNIVVGDLTVGGNVTVSGGKILLGSSNSVYNSASNLTLTSNSNVVSMQQTTGAFIPPYGTTAQRPATPVTGMYRWNTDLGWTEVWSGLAWVPITGSFQMSYLVVGGGAGGGGATYGGGGGGAGGYLLSSASFPGATTYTITVGSGGTQNQSGSNSSIVASGFTSVIAVGGGKGGFDNGTGSGLSGSSGGSGGGGMVTGLGGSATSGQGNAGGNGVAILGAGAGGGGGGAGSAGSPGFNIGDNYARGGGGGSSNSTTITGSSVAYCGGGGGGGYTYGSGGGASAGNGADGNTVAGSASANTGSGGGGGAYNKPDGGSGGSGIVIISYQSSYARATGGTITTYTSGGFTYYVHTFTSSGTFITT